MVALQSLLAPGAGVGWTLETAYDINNAGQFSGTGWLQGVRHGFILTPVPEPGTLLLFGLGGLLLTGRLRAGTPLSS
jgi:hypothetical protein